MEEDQDSQKNKSAKDSEMKKSSDGSERSSSYHSESMSHHSNNGSRSGGSSSEEKSDPEESKKNNEKEEDSEDSDNQNNYEIEVSIDKINVKAKDDAFIYQDNLEEAKDEFNNFNIFTKDQDIIIKNKETKEIWINCMKTNKTILRRLLKNCNSIVFDNFEINPLLKENTDIIKVMKCFSKIKNSLFIKKITIISCFRLGNEQYQLYAVNLFKHLNNFENIII